MSKTSDSRRIRYFEPLKNDFIIKKNLKKLDDIHAVFPLIITQDQEKYVSIINYFEEF